MPAKRAEASGVAREKRLEARDVEAIFRAFAEVLRELPPDTEAGFLDAEGDLRLAPAMCVTSCARSARPSASSRPARAGLFKQTTKST